MASIVDEHMARHGHIRPERAGIYWARAGDAEWVRDDSEAERDFIARARAEARARGYRTLRIGGAVNTEE